jgi:hypothetical protein
MVTVLPDFSHKEDKKHMEILVYRQGTHKIEVDRGRPAGVVEGHFSRYLGRHGSAD